MWERFREKIKTAILKGACESLEQWQKKRRSEVRKKKKRAYKRKHYKLNKEKYHTWYLGRKARAEQAVKTKEESDLYKEIFGISLEDKITKEHRFEIEIIVKHNGKKYTETRLQNGDGCNHYDNIPSTADYMARTIREKIKNQLDCTSLKGGE